MKIILNKKTLAKAIINEKNLGFVPTMGSIHLGHISLIKKSITQCTKTIVSIFVNKPQFHRKIDYNSYPRSLKNDILLLKKNKVDYLFLPSFKQIYPEGENKKIKISKFGNKLCGKYRPKHFEAVVDVVERFVNLIKPKRIFFGEKDMQQLKIIEHYLNINYPNIKVIPCKTIRSSNGVALSSRNFLLSSIEINIAAKVYKLLRKNKNKIIKKIYSIGFIKKKLYEMGVNKIDYIQLLNTNRLMKPYKNTIKFKIFIAYYLGSIRLIDNV